MHSVVRHGRRRACTPSESTRPITTPPPASCRTGAWSRPPRRSASRTSSTASGPVPFSTWELPFHAIDYCLREAGIALADVDHVAYSYDPYLLLGQRRGRRDDPAPARAERAADAGRVGVAVGPALPVVDRQRAAATCSTARRTTCRRASAASAPTARSAGTSSRTTSRHAASAFHASPFERAAVLTLDGRGEKATTGYARRRTATDLEWLGQVAHAALARHAVRAGDRATSASCTRPTSTR